MSVGARMDAEWERLVHSPGAATALQRWASLEPQLAEHANLDVLRAAVHDRNDLVRGDELLAALVRLAAVDGHNDLLATRVVLQMLLPGANKLARSLSWMADPPTSEAMVLGELTAQIRTYPWRRRPRRVAANLLLDTRQQLTRGHRRTQQEVPSGLDPEPQRHLAPAHADEAHEARLAIVELLRWTRRNGILAEDEVQVLFSHYVRDLPPSEVAAAIGRSRSTGFAIRQRAEAKLRQALPGIPGMWSE